ncbi:MAG: 6-phosphogluconolactonase [Bacteroidetes bacterium]|nr:MAG: 6-phosphogluconolactonase [Bacteroidota bacterium]
MELKRFENKEQMSLSAAAYTSKLIRKNTSRGDVFTIALSGGSSPVRFYELLAKEEIDWSLVNIFLVDERKVDVDHEYSNYRMINNALLSKIDIPETNVFSFEIEINSVSECAANYEKRVRQSFEDKYPVFDLIVLGLGPDGHTASLFPGEDHTIEQDHIFIQATAPEQFDIPERLTMTLALINRADKRIFVISGKGKNGMVQRVFDEDRTIPAGLINSNSTIFFDNFL